MDTQTRERPVLADRPFAEHASTAPSTANDTGEVNREEVTYLADRFATRNFRHYDETTNTVVVELIELGRPRCTCGHMLARAVAG